MVNMAIQHGERFNTVSHLVGSVAALVGAVFILVMAGRQGDAWKIVSFSVYGGALLSLYVSSTLYHGSKGPLKIVFRKLDHCSIYLLIAGTYTPFALVSLRDGCGWPVFCAIWTLAIFGILYASLFERRGPLLPVVFYLFMGWLIVLVLEPLTQVISISGVLWLAAGGLLYSVGVIFYVLDEKLRHSHGIWHLFVLGGSVSHFMAVLLYVA